MSVATMYEPLPFAKLLSVVQHTLSPLDCLSHTKE